MNAVSMFSTVADSCASKLVLLKIYFGSSVSLERSGMAIVAWECTVH